MTLSQHLLEVNHDSAFRHLRFLLRTLTIRVDTSIRLLWDFKTFATYASRKIALDVGVILYLVVVLLFLIVLVLDVNLSSISFFISCAAGHLVLIVEFHRKIAGNPKSIIWGGI